MFTGIIQSVGRVTALERRGGLVRLAVEPDDVWGPAPALGDSIAVQGCCLTVAQAVAPGGPLTFDVVPETLARTTLGSLDVGAKVNLEASVTPATLLGGHVVQGHVDGVGVFERVQASPEWRVAVRPPPDLMQYVIPKGSVAIDGVSLTVASVDPAGGTFDVALIPTTLAKTTLGASCEGHRCNLECDAIAKTVVHWLKHYGALR
ncbi:MAG: riboflavin synthase [Phycisphaerae bacterium]|nr:riboflavin synthase [Phycisphaerae bacterium]